MPSPSASVLVFTPSTAEAPGPVSHVLHAKDAYLAVFPIVQRFSVAAATWCSSNQLWKRHTLTGSVTMFLDLSCYFLENRFRTLIEAKRLQTQAHYCPERCLSFPKLVTSQVRVHRKPPPRGQTVFPSFQDMSWAPFKVCCKSRMEVMLSKQVPLGLRAPAASVSFRWLLSAFRSFFTPG